MTFATKGIFAALFGATVLTALPAAAQDANRANIDEDGAETTEADTMIDQAALGYRLAEYARITEDPQAMLVAARILKRITFREGDNVGEIEVENGNVAARQPDSGQAPPPLTADSLLDEAETLALDDDDLLEMIDDLRASETRGATRGPISVRRHVPRSTAWKLEFDAKGGEPLLVTARRDGKTRLDLKIYDENGYLVCQDKSHGSVIRCRVNPAWSGPFTVRLINHGGTGTGVQLLTN